jgi:Fe-S cluster biogenesis protein NfuA
MQHKTGPGAKLRVDLTIHSFGSTIEQSEEANVREKVEAALKQVRQMLLADGGDVRLIDVKDGVVKVKLTGACGGCPMATMTLKGGIERVLKEKVPGVKEVVAV